MPCKKDSREIAVSPLLSMSARGGTRTPMGYAHWILNPARLPIPPLSQALFSRRFSCFRLTPSTGPRFDTRQAETNENDTRKRLLAGVTDTTGPCSQRGGILRKSSKSRPKKPRPEFPSFHIQGDAGQGRFAESSGSSPKLPTSID